jgi:uncharacterized protein YjdB
MTAYIPTVWEDEVPASSPVKYKLVGDVEGTISDSATIEVVTDITAGTPMNATNLNKLEQGVEDAQTAADAAQTAADAAQVDADVGVFLFGLRDLPVFIPLNGSTALTTNDKAYWRVPAKGPAGVFNGTLVSVAAMCVGASSSGAVTLTVKKNGTTMLTTNITLDAGETDTLTADIAAVIAAGNDVTTGDHIAIEVSGSGTGVTYCGVELVFRPDD